MKSTYLLLFVGVALAVATGGVAAAGGQDTPGWADEDAASNGSDNTTSVSPGQQLTGAVGAQGASLQGALLNRSLSERLANAMTPDQRAAVLTNEIASLESYVETLEAVRENLTEAWETGELSKGEYQASLAEFVVRARTLERRANKTARVAADLPASVRESHDIDLSRVRDLSEQSRALYQFEGELSQAVVNETLRNERNDRALVAASGATAYGPAENESTN